MISLMNLARTCVSTALLLVMIPTALCAADSTSPDRENVAYGPHERNVLDLWLAKSDQPTPLVVFIHGGGFVNGDKSKVRGQAVIGQCLSAGVSFASINYRFRQHAPIQDILRDAARAVQFIRHHAGDWNIDQERIACYGSSAGAGTSLWLAFHDDLADPDSADPVLRQSTRLSAAGSLNGQASYDLRDWEPLLGKSPFERPPTEWAAFYGFGDLKEIETPAADAVMKDCSMVNLISRDDPAVAVACAQPDGESRDRGHYLHHPKHSQAIADRCGQHGIECLLLLRDESAPRDRQNHTWEVVAFLIEQLKK